MNQGNKNCIKFTLKYVELKIITDKLLIECLKDFLIVNQEYSVILPGVLRYLLLRRGTNPLLHPLD